jgi:branched-chain amino acid transport system ATP-binding protein
MRELLAIERLSAGYGEARVLSEVSFKLHEGESLALLGRNGMGKTTLVNSIIGVTRRFGGALRLGGRDITRLGPEGRAAAGIGWVPQERSIFRSLSVEENLTAVARPGPWTPGRIFALFPRLEERRANPGTSLSGGEQQMLAIGRALALNPRLLLLDEPLEGLAPVLARELLGTLARLVREEGTATIVVEQNARAILAMTDRALVLERGSVVHEAAAAALRADAGALERFLGVGSAAGAQAALGIRRADALAAEASTPRRHSLRILPS